MLDPFVRTGLEPVVREFGIVLDDDIVIDEASHFWTDVSSPAVTDYNRHEITRDLPLTFFPGARSLSPTPQRVPGTSAVPLVNSSKSSWGQASPDRVGLVKGRDLPGPNTLMVVALRRPVALRGRSPSRGPTVSDRGRGRLGLRHQLLLSHHGQRHAVPEHGQLSGRAGKPHRASTSHRRHPRINLTNRQMKRDRLSLGDPHPRPARGGRYRGVVEAALSPVPRRAGLVAVWALPGVLAVGIAALEWTDRASGEFGKS